MRQGDYDYFQITGRPAQFGPDASERPASRFPQSLVNRVNKFTSTGAYDTAAPNPKSGPGESVSFGGYAKLFRKDIPVAAARAAVSCVGCAEFKTPFSKLF